MTPEQFLEPVRDAARHAMLALRNGRPTRTEKLAARFGLIPNLPQQAIAGDIFVSAAGSDALSAIIKRAKNGFDNERIILLKGKPDLPKLAFDRDVIEADKSSIWEGTAETVGDNIARNIRLLTFAEHVCTTEDGGRSVTEILSNEPKTIHYAFTLLRTILAASGRTGDEHRLTVTLPTATRPLQVIAHGFALNNPARLAFLLDPLLAPALQIWRTAPGRTVRVSRVSANASAAGSSPVESLRAVDTLVKQFGEGLTERLLLL